jgi:hypothetical protein
MLEYHPETPLLVAAHDCNQTNSIYSTDTFNHQRKYPRWPITYNFNSLGYRTKEINQLDNNFLLTFGCSYTEGVGLRTDQIWTDHISKYLSLDLYNAAKQASGPDIPSFNTLLWNTNNAPTPKIVIVQWPQKTRKHFAFKDSVYIPTVSKSKHVYLKDMSETHTPDGRWWGKRYIVNTGEMSVNIYQWFESFNNTWKLAGVPVLNFTWDDDIEQEILHSKYKLWHITPTTYDKARDDAHDGPIFHQETADALKEILSKSNFTDKV